VYPHLGAGRRIRHLDPEHGVEVGTVRRDEKACHSETVGSGTRRRYVGYSYRASGGPPLTLTPGEASALIASLVAVGPYISASAQTVLGKLLAALAPTGSSGHR
jgi:predicted DNA-binding transcriptional regulator YafY